MGSRRSVLVHRGLVTLEMSYTPTYTHAALPDAIGSSDP